MATQGEYQDDIGRVIAETDDLRKSLAQTQPTCSEAMNKYQHVLNALNGCSGLLINAGIVTESITPKATTVAEQAHQAKQVFQDVFGDQSEGPSRLRRAGHGLDWIGQTADETLADTTNLEDGRASLSLALTGLVSAVSDQVRLAGKAAHNTAMMHLATIEVYGELEAHKQGLT